MTEGDKLLDKADALLAKYRENENFPVLTEIVELRPDEPLVAPLPADLPPLSSTLSDQDSSLDKELRELEENLRKDILHSVQPYLDAHLAEPMELRIQMHLESALAHITSEVISAVRMDISNLVRKAVAEAVEREITALRTRLGPR